jgi:hypothetical protein
MPWHYPMSSLVTLCDRCHAVQHGKIPGGAAHDSRQLELFAEP